MVQTTPKTKSDQNRATDTATRFVDPWIPTVNSESASNTVHKSAKSAESATQIGGIAGGAAAGGAIGGVIGAVLGAIVGGIIGGVVSEWVAGLVERIGGAIVNALGMDFIQTGKTPGGGNWTNVSHPDGTYDRVENSGGFTIIDSTDSSGYHESIDGNGYHSDFTENERGTSFNARDTDGGYHGITTDREGDYVTADTDNRGNSNVHSSDANGNSSDFSTRTENGGVTTTERNTTKDPNTGDTTTTTKVTHPDGKTEEKTEYKDKDGNPKEPPEHGKGGMENPEGGTDEGPRVKLGDFGKPRPGHPNDLVLVPGHSGEGDDFKEGNDRFYARLSDALRGMALVINTGGGSDTGWGDASGSESAPDLRRKLKGAHFGWRVRGSGEDFIHPKARAALLSRIALAITKGRLL